MGLALGPVAVSLTGCDGDRAQASVAADAGLDAVVADDLAAVVSCSDELELPVPDSVSASVPADAGTGPCVISGTVLLVGRDDHAGTTVTALPAGRIATTGPTGAFDIEGLSAGEYGLALRNGDFQEFVPRVLCAEDSPARLVEDGKTYPMAPFEIPKARRVYAGFVVLPSNRWDEGRVPVSLRSYDEPILAFASSPCGGLSLLADGVSARDEMQHTPDRSRIVAFINQEGTFDGSLVSIRTDGSGMVALALRASVLSNVTPRQDFVLAQGGRSVVYRTASAPTGPRTAGMDRGFLHVTSAFFPTNRTLPDQVDGRPDVQLSRDGGRILFRTVDDRGIVADLNDTRLYQDLGAGETFALSPDGGRVAFKRCDVMGSMCDVLLLWVFGGETIRLGAGPRDSPLVFASDGARLFFVDEGNRTVSVLAATGGGPAGILSERPATSANLRHALGGTKVIFRTRGQLEVADVAGGGNMVIGGVDTWDFVAGDSHILVGGSGPNPPMWIQSLVTGERSIISDQAYISYFLLSPDRASVLFLDNRPEESTLRIAPTDGSAPARMVDDGRGTSFAYSSDAKWLSYVRRPGEELRVVPASGGAPPVVIMRGGAAWHTWADSTTLLIARIYDNPPFTFRKGLYVARIEP